MTYQVQGERDVEKISERQQELYQQNRAVKRACSAFAIFAAVSIIFRFEGAADRQTRIWSSAF